MEEIIKCAQTKLQSISNTNTTQDHSTNCQATYFVGLCSYEKGTFQASKTSHFKQASQHMFQSSEPTKIM